MYLCMRKSMAFSILSCRLDVGVLFFTLGSDTYFDSVIFVAAAVVGIAGGEYEMFLCGK